MQWLQRAWLFLKEVGAVAYATRVPGLLVVVVFALLAVTEPAQDMLAEAVFDFIFGSGWLRASVILVCLVFFATNAWYWARVLLMYHRAMPELAASPEGAQRSRYRPRIVLWWPRIVGTMPFIGAAAGFAAAALQHSEIGASEESTRLWLAVLFALGLGALFLTILILRRHLLPGGKEAIVSGMPWKLGDLVDPRAPYEHLLDIRAGSSRPRDPLRFWGNLFLLATLAVAFSVLVWAAASPVSLADWFGGLAVALLAAALMVPFLSLLSALGATSRLPVFGSLIVLVLLVPSVNGWLFEAFDLTLDNHAVRTIGTGPVERAKIDVVFEDWLKERYENKQTKPPFIVVAAEGGASRAGYWTALSVGELLRQKPELRDSIFAISSVSGGSLGAVLIRALIDLDRIQQQEFALPAEQRVVCDSGEKYPAPYLSCIRVFMERDFLASAFTGMFFVDVLQRPLLTSLVRLPDRAEAIERSWEASWDDVVRKLKHEVPAQAGRPVLKDRLPGLFGRGFAASWAKDAKGFDGLQPAKAWPVLLLNGTNVETGRRVITSNVEMITTRAKGNLPCATALTAYGHAHHKAFGDCHVWEDPAVHDPLTTMQRDIPISTAVNMSARFPIVMPAGGIEGTDGKRRYHVVDGGIYENFGAATLVDLVRRVLLRNEAEIPDRGIKPMIVLLSTDHELDGVRQATSAYAGNDDFDTAVPPVALEPVERRMKLGCGKLEDHDPPVCSPPVMTKANEVLGVPLSLYRTRSGRGEASILGLRELIHDRKFHDEAFFHFRQCMNAKMRPASMTWYVSGASQKFMDGLLPSVRYGVPVPPVPPGEVVEWINRVREVDTDQRAQRQQRFTENVDPCHNHAEMKRLLDLHHRIIDGKR